MGPGWAIVHQSAGCTSEIATFIETGSQFLIAINFILSETKDTDAYIFLFSYWNFFLLDEPINYPIIRSTLMVEQVMQFFMINF